MERHALTSRFNIMHFPFHFSQHHFKVCIGMHLEIEFSARYTTDFSYPPIIFFLFIIHLLFISIFWDATNNGNYAGQSFHRSATRLNCEMNSRNRRSLFSS